MNTLRTLRRRYGRTTLITVGIALAIAFSTIMLSIGEAIQQSSLEIIEETEVDLLVEPPVDLPPLFLELSSIFEIKDGRKIAEAMVNNNSKIQAAAPWLIKNMYIAKELEEINSSKPPIISLTACKGMIPNDNRYFDAFEITAGQGLPTQNDPFYAKGTYNGGTESENFTHEIVISEKLAKILEVGIGEMIYLNPIAITDEFTNESIASWYENATWFKVYGMKVGSFESQNALSAQIHLSELQYLAGKTKRDSVNSIYLSLYDKSDREEVKHWLQTDFIYRNNISVHTPEDLLEDITQLTKMLEGFSSMVVIITILVATLFISTVLMISTRERSSEIGALRAIGISKFTINKFILKESFVICILALIIGLVLGFLISNIINDYIVYTQSYLPPGFRVTLITPGLIAMVSALTLMIALLASLGPCYWAMKLKPVETLRAE